MNGSLVGGVQLKVKHVFQEPSFNLIFSAQVSLARRQPVIDPINDASSRSRTLKCFSFSVQSCFLLTFSLTVPRGRRLLLHTVRREATETNVRWWPMRKISSEDEEEPLYCFRSDILLCILNPSPAWSHWILYVKPLKINLPTILMKTYLQRCPTTHHGMLML